MISETVAMGDRLSIGGCDTVELVQQFGTPLYVYDELAIRRQCSQYRESFTKRFPGAVVAYSAKAFLCGALVRLLSSEGLWLDVNSGGELYLAAAAGWDPGRVIVHGNNKTRAELEFAVEMGAGRFCLDNVSELELLGEVAAERKRRPPVYLRITPGVAADTHKYVRTGDIDSKFGMHPEAGRAAAALAAHHPHLELVGLHAHVGSQLMSAEAICMGAVRLIELASDLKASGILIRELDVGGGLGTRYRDEQPIPVHRLASEIVDAVLDACSRHDVRFERLVVEPGRSVVAEAATALYRVGAVKESPNGKRYVSVDGGLGDNPRPALYGARYRACIADRPGAEATGRFDVVGRYCESGDMLVLDCPLPSPTPGDIIAVPSSGAYQVSMSSTYNMVPRPAVVGVRDGSAVLWVRRETWADLLVRDQWLQSGGGTRVAAAALPS